jgi:hypothetical protein
MGNFSLSRQLLSGYFIAIIIFVFIANLFKDSITFLASALNNIIYSGTTVKVDGTDNTWWIVFFTSLIVVFIIKQVIVDALGLNANEETAYSWEPYALLFLVIGSLMYNVNILFPEYYMPSLTPNFIVKLLHGSKFGLPLSTSSDIFVSNFFAPFLWNLGPFILMWSMHIRSKMGGKSHGSEGHH